MQEILILIRLLIIIVKEQDGVVYKLLNRFTINFCRAFNKMQLKNGKEVFRNGTQ